MAIDGFMGLSFQKKWGPMGGLYTGLLIQIDFSKIICVWTFYFPFWVCQISNHWVHVRGFVGKVTSYSYWEHEDDYNQHWVMWESTCVGKGKFELGKKLVL